MMITELSVFVPIMDVSNRLREMEAVRGRKIGG